MLELQKTEGEIRIDIVNGLIESYSNQKKWYEDKLNNYDNLDKSLLENKLNKEGFLSEIETISDIINALNLYKNSINI